jgi:hypothetical protein
MVQTAMQRLANHIDTIPHKFREFSSDELLQPRAPGKWSRQQILGHLIDSGMNNLRRFIEAPMSTQPYIIQPYKQVELVIANNYQQLPLEHLLQLWTPLNRQIIYAVENIAEEKLSYVVVRPDGGKETLTWLICDYVDHMEHHWKQVFF